MPLMALVLGRLTANFTNFGSIDNQQSSDEFIEQVETNTRVHFRHIRMNANHRSLAYGLCTYLLRSLLCVSCFFPYLYRNPPTSGLSKRVARLCLYSRFYPHRESDGASATSAGMRDAHQDDQVG